MSVIKFDDGFVFNTDGALRIERRHDGLYVVGRGMLCPVNSRKEGQELADAMGMPLAMHDKNLGDP